jgi:hypothetical protein
MGNTDLRADCRRRAPSPRTPTQPRLCGG